MTGMEIMEKKRLFGPDAVRAAAALLVIAEHFFLNTHYYDVPLIGPTMALCTWLRMLFMSCTPMFMMLTGWLCIRKMWKKGYLRGLLPVLAVWLLSSFLCLLFRRYWMKEPITMASAILSVLDFTAVPYGWYVEMYLGLFLLMPFLNAAWDAVDRTGRRNLLLALLTLTLIPGVINHYHQVLPDWWSGLYPVAYYVLGAWLKEYPLKLKNSRLLLGWLGIAALTAALRWLDTGGDVFTWANFADRSSALVAAQSVCLFSFLSRCSGERCPAWLRRGTVFLAKLSLPLFLASYISDNLFYPYYCALLPNMKLRLLFFPVILLADATLSALIAWGVHTAAGQIIKLIPKRPMSVEKS